VGLEGHEHLGLVFASYITPFSVIKERVERVNHYFQRPSIRYHYRGSGDVVACMVMFSLLQRRSSVSFFH